MYLISSKKIDGKRLCATCNPNSKTTQAYNENRAEMKVNRHLAETLPDFTVYAIGTYAPFKSCGDYKRPDTILVQNDFMAIVETDERAHDSPNYEISCEMTKALQHGQSALQSDNVHRVAFIRFNPDAWKVAGETVRMKLKEKLSDLSALIEKLFIEQTTDEPFVFYTMFYPGETTEDRIQKVAAEELDAWVEKLLDRSDKVIEETAGDWTRLVSG